MSKPYFDPSIDQRVTRFRERQKENLKRHNKMSDKERTSPEGTMQFVGGMTQQEHMFVQKKQISHEEYLRARKKKFGY